MSVGRLGERVVRENRKGSRAEWMVWSLESGWDLMGCVVGQRRGGTWCVL